MIKLVSIRVSNSVTPPINRLSQSLLLKGKTKCQPRHREIDSFNILQLLQFELSQEPTLLPCSISFPHAWMVHSDGKLCFTDGASRIYCRWSSQAILWALDSKKGFPNTLWHDFSLPGKTAAEAVAAGVVPTSLPSVGMPRVCRVYSAAYVFASST